METMRCIWCEKETTTDKKLKNENLKFANKEHVFPEGIDGNKCLPIGLVCQDCNNNLGTTIDDKLKYSSPIFMNLYQKSSLINEGNPIGKSRKGKDKLRKEEEIYKIESKVSDLIIERNKSNINETTITNFSPTRDENEYNDCLSLGIHKCAFNCVVNHKGYEYTHLNYLELRNFILNGSKNIKERKEIDGAENWSYAVCYSSDELVKFEPQDFTITNEEGNIDLAILLFFPTAIFIVGLQPNIINANNLKNIVSNLPDFSNMLNINDFNYKLHYKKSFKYVGLSKETFSNPINELEFEIVAKPISFITEDKNKFYVLTECNFCRNITPINFFIPKSAIDSFDISCLNANSSCLHCKSGINSTDNKLFVKK